MSTQVLSQQLVQILEAASQLVDVTDSAALLLVVEQRLDWSRLRGLLGTRTVLVASDDESHLAGVTDHGMSRIMIDVTGLPVHERLTQALLECVAEDEIGPESPSGRCLQWVRGGHSRFRQCAPIDGAPWPVDES